MRQSAVKGKFFHAAEYSCVQEQLCQKGPGELRKVHCLTKTKANPERKLLSMNDTGNAAAATAMGLGMIVFMLFVLVIAVAVYVFICFCFKRICEKCGVNPGVLIWIPIVQLVPLLQAAKMPVWMIILFLIPVVGLIISIMMWVKICQARGKSGWLVVLLFIPIANIILFLTWRFRNKKSLQFSHQTLRAPNPDAVAFALERRRMLVVTDDILQFRPCQV